VKLPAGSLSRRKLFKSAAEFDGVLLHKKGLNPFDAMWLRRYGKKIIYHFDDAIMYSDKSPEHYSLAHFRPWKRSVELADMVIVSSPYLAEHARRFNSNVKILSTAIKVSDYRCNCSPRNDNKVRLVWIGSKSTLLYIKGIKPALEEIGLRFDNVVLRLVCDDFFDMESMPVEKYLWSAEKRGQYLGACDIGLAPLPDNPFTQGKCSFKVLEYSASALPVIASPVGTNADHIVEGVTGFLAVTDDDWIEKISFLIDKADMRHRMGKNGRRHCEQYDINIIGQRFAELILTLTGKD